MVKMLAAIATHSFLRIPFFQDKERKTRKKRMLTIPESGWMDREVILVKRARRSNRFCFAKIHHRMSERVMRKKRFASPCGEVMMRRGKGIAKKKSVARSEVFCSRKNEFFRERKRIEGR
jgi:hypothetical protein